MSRVMVTGASGFIGRRAVPLLLAAGHEVEAVSTGPAPASSPEGVRWHRADLLDTCAVAPLVHAAAPTHLLHLAWYTEHGAFWSSPENGRWVDASLRLWGAFAGAGGRRAVFAGTCAEYEWGGEQPLSEESTPLRPATLYGKAKDELRRAVEADAGGAGISVAWGRIFFAYGPGEHPGRLVPSVARALLEGRPAEVSDGEQLRDFLHVDDLAAAFAGLLDSELGGAVNIGSGEGTKVKQVVETLGRVAGRPELIKLGAIPRPEGDPDAIVADPARIREELGWSPRIELERGLAETLASLRA